MEELPIDLLKKHRDVFKALIKSSMIELKREDREREIKHKEKLEELRAKKEKENEERNRLKEQEFKRKENDKKLKSKVFWKEFLGSIIEDDIDGKLRKKEEKESDDSSDVSGVFDCAEEEPELLQKIYDVYYEVFLPLLKEKN